MKANKQKAIGRIQASLTALAFGLLGVFGKWGFSSGFSVGELMAYRFFMASVLLWIVVLLFKRRWIKIPLKQIGIFALLGIFGYAAMSITYLSAIKGLSLTTAVLILYTYPFWVSLFSHFFTKNKITKKEVVCLIIGAVGLVLLLGGHIEVKEFWAVISGLASAIIYAAYILLSEKYQNGTPPLASSLYVITFGALALFVFYHPNVTGMNALPHFQLFTILGIAFICTILPLTLELAALQKIKSTEFSVIMMLEPISATMWGAIIFKEVLSPQQIVGALTILGALGLRFIKTSSSTRPSLSDQH